MILSQNFIYANKDVPTGANSLYFTGEKVSTFENILTIKKSANFSTWFNSLNTEKWLNYTNVKSFSIEINYEGSGIIEILNNLPKKKDTLLKKTLNINLNKLIIEIPITDKTKLLSVKISTETEIKLNSAKWILNIKESTKNNINCAIVICTHNRHNYLSNTVKTLKKHLPKNWGVYIVDNESTPPVQIEQDPRFKLIRNKNTGGSGGFTRGIIEAGKSYKNWTHVLLMDDDIVLDGNALSRTNTFLSVLKKEYFNYFLSGGMLRLDKPTIQHESSAVWNGIRVKHLNHNLDLSNLENILKSEKIVKNKRTYAAWWYCVIPLNKSVTENLPLPFFVNGDDIEYSLRHADGILTLNGISVWHEPFHLKYNPIKQHYLTTRNGLFINTMHNYGRIKTVLMAGLRYTLQRVKGHKYESNLVALGIEDFLKGPDVLIKKPNPFQMDKNPQNSSYFKILKMLIKITKNYKTIQNNIYQFSLSKTYWHDINKN